MINTGLDDVNKAYDKARMVIQEVGPFYSACCFSGVHMLAHMGLL